MKLLKKNIVRVLTFKEKLRILIIWDYQNNYMKVMC